MTSNYFIEVSSNTDSILIGNKGKNLQILSNNRFNIPKTYFITTNAYECFIKKNSIQKIFDGALQDKRLNNKSKSETIVNSILSKQVPQEILTILINFKFFNDSDSKWAIRSSSNLEDLPGASFAGLYDSYLNVTGLDNIITAIKKCWASLWSERALIYREEKNLNHFHAKMGIIIQQMINAEYAGVLFTKDPSSNNRKEMFLEYCEGLGERLVSGEITPYSCRINTSLSKVTYLNKSEQRKFQENHINNLVSEGIKIEKHFGAPQDIEWAFDGKKIYILQTRPITNKTFFDVHLEKNIWTRANIGEVLPDVITPLTWSVFKATLMNCPDLALKPSKIAQNNDDGIKRIHGRGYIQLNHFLDSFCYLPFVTPKVMSKVLGVNLPQESESYKRPNGLSVRLAQCLFILNCVGLLPRLSWMVKQLPPLPDRDTTNIGESIVWNAKCFRLHLKCTAYAIGAFGMLAHFLDRWLPSDAEALLPKILIGHENLQTAAQGISLWQIAEHVRSHSALWNLLMHNHDWPFISSHLSGIDGGRQFMTMFQEFMDSNGDRAAGEFELAVPRWREEPTFVLNVIRKFLSTKSEKINVGNPDERRCQQQKAVSHISKALGPLKRWIFLKLLSFYRDNTTFRENIKYHLIKGYSLLRQIFLKLGRNLETKGILDKANDIFFLTPSEALELNAGKFSAPKKHELILKRKAQHDSWESHNPPNMIIDDGQETLEYQGDTLTGIGCSPGTVKGVARVLFDISEADVLKPGEILVAPHTDPGWTPLFLSCKAVVTEIGGFLSHGATVAREYGIPAVANVANVTQLLKTGDVIQVNGTKGLVTICK